MPRRHNRRPPIRKRYDQPNKIPLAELYMRFGGICQFKMHPISLEEATRDHLTPKSHGGRNGHNYENIVLMCKECNVIKGSELIERIA
jgi:5-methylcytosine-specific restriction endonuclease McrA